MPRRPPEMALRRQVAELARARPEDVEEILGELDHDHRLRVETLLAEYLGLDTGRPIAAAGSPSAPVPREGLSPWIAERLGPRPHDDGRFRMTPAALEALAAVAVAKGGGGSAGTILARPPGPTSPRSWLRQWGRALSGQTPSSQSRSGRPAP